MQKTLKIVIHCGELTCYSEKKVPCVWLRTKSFGQVYTCGLFCNVMLAEDKPGGWLQRCSQCLAYTVGRRQNKKGKTLMEVFAEEDKKNEISTKTNTNIK